MSRSRLTAALVFASVLALAMAGSASASAAGCVKGLAARAGGEWRTLGHDLSGDRFQPAEHALEPAQAPQLAPAWTFKVSDGSVFDSTPTVADGCIFVGTGAPGSGNTDAGGDIIAVNADTGQVVWRRTFRPTGPGLLGTGVPGALTVQDGRVYALVSQAGDGKRGGPYAIALNESNGQTLWGPTVLDTRKGAYTDATPVIFRGLLFAGFNGDETYANSRGGYDILDARTGRVLVHRYSIDERDYNAGAGGGSIWATGAVDTRQQYLYVGTSNPVGDAPENAHTDAIIKVDMDPRRRTFGEIVDSIRGNPDGQIPRQDDPACGNVPHGLGGQPWPTGDGALSPNAFACARTDSDFGASPNLFMIGSRPLVGELQKSGVYHAVDLDGGMHKAWDATVSSWFFFGNMADSAHDPSTHTIYVAAGVPGQLFALGTDGHIKWVQPIGDVIHYQAVSVADGVVYTTDSLGYLWAWNARTGQPLLHRSLSADAGDSSDVAAESTVGVAIARHGLYLDGGDFLMRYKPSATSASAAPKPDSSLQEVCPHPGVPSITGQPGPNPGCVTEPVPGEGWTIAGTLPVRGKRRLELYRALLSRYRAYYSVPADPQLGFVGARLNVGSIATSSTDPGNGYQEMEVAVRVLERKTGEEGWFPLATAVNDSSEYSAGRMVGFPKWMADETIAHDHTTGVWTDTSAPPTQDTSYFQRYVYTPARVKPPDSPAARTLSRLVLYDDPMFTVVRPWDENDPDWFPERDKFTITPVIPGLDALPGQPPPTPFTQLPQPTPGTFSLTISRTVGPKSLPRFAGLLPTRTVRMPGMFWHGNGWVLISSERLDGQPGLPGKCATGPAYGVGSGCS